LDCVGYDSVSEERFQEMIDQDELHEYIKLHGNYYGTSKEVVTMIELCELAKSVLYQQRSLLILPTPITVCGDVHGQFYDFKKLFERGGPPSATPYLFLGDYINQGYYSIETLALLFAYLVQYGGTFHLLRGNHESRQVNTMYGFYDEVTTRFGHSGVWKLCNEVFDMLTLAALIDNKIDCVHGGLSPSIKLVEQIPLLEHPADVSNSSAVSDICWSNPEDNEGWEYNQRGAG
jgi:hypothetical protein